MFVADLVKGDGGDPVIGGDLGERARPDQVEEGAAGEDVQGEPPG